MLWIMLVFDVLKSGYVFPLLILEHFPLWRSLHRPVHCIVMQHREGPFVCIISLFTLIFEVRFIFGGFLYLSWDAPDSAAGFPSCKTCSWLIINNVLWVSQRARKQSCAFTTFSHTLFSCNACLSLLHFAVDLVSLETGGMQLPL